MKKIIAGLTLIFFAVDRVTKYVFESAFESNFFSAKNGVEIIPNLLKLNLYKNTGIALGLFQNSNLLFVFVTLVLILGLIFMIVTDRLNAIHPIFLSLLLGGAMGNLFDRVFYGGVTDFISLEFFSVFNLADLFISTGCLGAFIQSMKHE